MELCDQRGYIPLSSPDQIKNEASWFEYECPKHGIQKIRLRDFKRGHGCIGCKYETIGNKLRDSVENIITKIESKNNNKLLNPYDYVSATTPNLLVECGSCGEIFITSSNNYDKNEDGKCPHCSSPSKGEEIIKEILEKYNILYERQKKFPDCRYKRVLPFDFYLEDNNCLIEFDGQFHYKPIMGEENLALT